MISSYLQSALKERRLGIVISTLGFYGLSTTISCYIGMYKYAFLFMLMLVNVILLVVQ